MTKKLISIAMMCACFSLNAAQNMKLSSEPIVTSASTNDYLLLSSYGPGLLTRQIAIKNLPFVTGNTTSNRTPLNIASKVTLNNGVETQVATNAMCRIAEIAPASFGVTNIQLIYANWGLGGVAGLIPRGEVYTNNAFTLKASLEYPVGVMTPITFAGQRTVTIYPGNSVTSDIPVITLPMGANYWIRQYVTGANWPIGFVAACGDKNLAQTATGAYLINTTDKTDSGTIADTYFTGFSPAAILGTRTDDGYQYAVAIIGDSIVHGTIPETIAFNYDRTWLSEITYGVSPMMKIAISGWTDTNAVDCSRTLELTRFATHAVVELGINDVTVSLSYNQIQTNMYNLWIQLYNRGLKVYQTTITPCSTSSDDWATVENQTAHANNPNRILINDWIRTCPYPLSGYFEVADVVESSRNSGKWKAPVGGNKYTLDGLHTANYSGTNIINSGIIDVNTLTKTAVNAMISGNNIQQQTLTTNAFTGPTKNWFLSLREFETNTAPTSVTVGTTAPDYWIQVKDTATGFIFYTPAWTNH